MESGTARPAAVVGAERLYLGAVALLVATTAAAWGTMVAQFGFGVTLGASLFAVGLYLLLTLATTRRGSRVALWLLMLATGFAAVSLAFQAATGQLVPNAIGLANAIQAVLMLAGAVLLFRPDARAWFAAPHEDEDEDGDGDLIEDTLP